MNLYRTSTSYICNDRTLLKGRVINACNAAVYFHILYLPAIVPNYLTHDRLNSIRTSDRLFADNSLDRACKVISDSREVYRLASKQPTQEELGF